MPKFDVSLPKVNLPNVETKLEGLPAMNLPSTSIEVQGPKMKGGNIDMPSFDISGPVSPVAQDIYVKGAPGKHDTPEVDVSGTKKVGLHLPSVDISLPKFNLDLSLPSNKRIKGDADALEASGDWEISGFTGDIDQSKVKVKSADPDLNGGEAKGSTIKVPSVKLPSIDISAPKVDLDFGLVKPKVDDVEIELLKAEGGRPSSGGSFDLPNVSVRGPSFTLPRFGAKSKSGDLTSGKVPKGDISLSPPQMDAQTRAPSVEFDASGKVKKSKLKMPSFGLSKKSVDASVSCPDVDAKVNNSAPEINVQTSHHKPKYKIKFPKFKLSSPKGHPPEGKADAKLEADVKGKSGFQLPTAGISPPKSSLAGSDKDFGKPSGYVEAKAKVKMPSVELSLPSAKTPETEVLLPKAEIHVSEADIRGYEGNLKIPKMPSLEVSIPKIDRDVSLPKPNVDVSLPKGKTDVHKVKMEGDGAGKFQKPSIKMPSVNISFPKARIEDPNVELQENLEGKSKLPCMKKTEIDISLPGGNIKGPSIDMQADEGQFKMHDVDLSIPRAKANIEASEVKFHTDSGTRDSAQIKMPKLDILLPKVKVNHNVQLPTVVTEEKLRGPDATSPDLDIHIKGGKAKLEKEVQGETDVHVEGEHKGLKLKSPTTDIKSPKGDVELDTEFHKGDGKKDKKRVELPDLDLQTGETKVKGTKFKIGKPKKKAEKDITVNVQLQGQKDDKVQGTAVPSPTLPTAESNIEEEQSLKAEGKVPRIPDIEFDIGTSQDEDEDRSEREGKKIKIPKFGVPLPSISSPEGRMHLYGPEIQYEGPKIPRVKKAVFVLVNPSERDAQTSPSNVREKKQSEAETQDIKMSVSPDTPGSFNVSGSSLSGEHDSSPLEPHSEDKQALSGRIKLPKIEFTSHYGKMTAKNEGMSLKPGRDPIPGDKDGKTQGQTGQRGKVALTGLCEGPTEDVVSSPARTDLLDRDSSESHTGATSDLSPAKVQSWSTVQSKSWESDEKESSSWFKVPKFTLKPHSTGKDE